MSDHPSPAEGHPVLRAIALTAVCAGVLVLAAAAFALSYPGVHAVALQAGVSRPLARVYPVIFDAMLVITCAAVLSLRGAGLISRCYAWLSLLVLLGAAAGADTLHATGTRPPHRTAAAVAAITPWALLLIGFGLLMVMLRHARLRRAAAAAKAAAQAAAAPPPEPARTAPALALPAGGTQYAEYPQAAQYQEAQYQDPAQYQPTQYQPTEYQPTEAAGLGWAGPDAEHQGQDTGLAVEPAQDPDEAGQTSGDQDAGEAILAAPAAPSVPQPRTAEPRTAEPRTAEPRTAEPRTAEPRTMESQPAAAEPEERPNGDQPQAAMAPPFHRLWSSPTPPDDDQA